MSHYRSFISQGDLNSKMVTISEKERQANERILELQARLQSSDSQLASNRQEKSRLAAQVEVLQARCELSDERAAKEKARCDTLQGEQVRLLDDLRREKVDLTTCLIKALIIGLCVGRFCWNNKWTKRRERQLLCSINSSLYHSNR